MKKILIADDQAGWRMFHTEAIKGILGNNVVLEAVPSAQEAYNLLLTNFLEPYDVIITDMQMEDDYAPKMAGEWLLEQIKGIAPYASAKVVVISASPMSRHIADEYGAMCFSKSEVAASAEVYKQIIE